MPKPPHVWWIFRAFWRQIHTDLGINFEGKLFHELCQLTGIKKTHTTSFHAQSDGQTEKINRTLLQMLRTTADENPQRLHTVMSAYRMTVHSVTGLTPNMAMLVREVLLPVTLIAKPQKKFPWSLSLLYQIYVILSAMHIAGYVKPRKQPPRHRKSTTTVEPKPVKFVINQLVWLYWPKPPVRMKYKSYNDFGLVHGKSSDFKHRWS